MKSKQQFSAVSMPNFDDHIHYRLSHKNNVFSEKAVFSRKTTVDPEIFPQHMHLPAFIKFPL